MYGVCADRADHQDHWCHDGEGDAQDGCEEGHRRQHHNQSCNIAEIHGGNQAPDEIFLLLEEQRPGLQAPYQQAAEQHGGSRRSGDTQCQHRQQRRRTGCVRGRFRCDHTFDFALAEVRAIGRHALGHAITHERSRRRASRRNTHPAANGRRTQRGFPVFG